jgi:hypothetical protein
LTLFRSQSLIQYWIKSSVNSRRELINQLLFSLAVQSVILAICSIS